MTPCHPHWPSWGPGDRRHPPLMGRLPAVGGTRGWHPQAGKVSQDTTRGLSVGLGSSQRSKWLPGGGGVPTAAAGHAGTPQEPGSGVSAAFRWPVTQLRAQGAKAQQCHLHVLSGVAVGGGQPLLQLLAMMQLLPACPLTPVTLSLHLCLSLSP